MERLTNILKIVENQRLGYNVPKQVDLAYSKLKCLAGDLKFFYDDNERLFSPVFTSKFCPIKGYENYMISANEEGKVCLIDTDAPRGKKVIASFQAHVNAIYDLAWVNQNISFISAAADQSANLWQLVEGRVQSVHQFLGHTHSVKAVTCMPDDPNVFATGGRDGSLIVWDKRVQSSAHEISPSAIEPYKIINHSHEDKSFFKPKKCGSQKTSVTGLVFQDTDNLISCSAGDGLIKVWDMRKTYCVKKRMPQPKHTLVYNGEGKNGFSYLAISPCRLRLYANCIDNFVYCYDIGTYKEKPIGVYGGLKGSSFYIKNAVSPDGRYIATGSSDAKAYVWSTSKQITPIVSLSGHSAEVTCVDWCKSGELKMVSCSDDSTIRVWRLHPEEIACNDPKLRGWAERHSFIIHKKVPKNVQSTPKRKYMNSDMMTPPKNNTEQNNENISPEIRQAEKKQCRGGSSSIDMSSLTADLPNFVIDGTSPHNHRCVHPPKSKETNWLNKLKDRASGSRPQQLFVRRKSSSNSSSPARDSLLKFFKVSSSRSSNICEQPSIPSPDPNKKTPSVKA